MKVSTIICVITLQLSFQNFRVNYFWFYISKKILFDIEIQSLKKVYLVFEQEKFKDERIREDS